MSQLYTIRRKTKYCNYILDDNLDMQEARRIFRTHGYRQDTEYICDDDGNDVTKQVLDGYPRITERRVLFMTSVRGLCIRYRWYTCGTNEEYAAMLHKVEDYLENVDTYFLYEIAKNIMEHSRMENDETIESVMSELALHSHMIYTIEEE